MDDYIHLIAFTKKVHKKGSATQNHSGEKYNNPKMATNEIMVYTQYIFTDSTATVIIKKVSVRDQMASSYDVIVGKNKTFE